MELHDAVKAHILVFACIQLFDIVILAHDRHSLVDRLIHHAVVFACKNADDDDDRHDQNEQDQQQNADHLQYLLHSCPPFRYTKRRIRTDTAFDLL